MDDLARLTPAIATLQVDNERVRVTRWQFPPGSETGWHRHGHDYVITALTDNEVLAITSVNNVVAVIFGKCPYH